MSKNRVVCLIICAVLLIGAIWLCGCGESSSTDEDVAPSYIIITYPNSPEIYVKGYGKCVSYRDWAMIRAKIDGVTYWTDPENVLVKKDSH